MKKEIKLNFLLQFNDDQENFYAFTTEKKAKENILQVINENTKDTMKIKVLLYDISKLKPKRFKLNIDEKQL